MWILSINNTLISLTNTFINCQPRDKNDKTSQACVKKTDLGIVWQESRGETESVFYLNGPSFIGVLDRNKIELNTLWVRLKILNWTRKLFSPSLRRIYFYFLSILQFYCFFMLSVGPEHCSCLAADRCNKWNQRKKSISAARNVTFYILLSAKFAINKESRLFPGLMYLTVKLTWLPFA